MKDRDRDEELLIGIECLECQKSEIELAIVKPTEYGRWPSPEEFLMIGKKCHELEIITAKIEVLKDVNDAIVANNKTP